MKDTIRLAALQEFDQKGFYRTGIRDIAKLAGCSLPTLYYYYQHKEALFEAAVCDTYETLTLQIQDQLPEGLSLLDRYYFAVLQRQLLTPDEKRVFRIALKMQLGVEGFDGARTRLSRYEEARLAEERRIIAAEVDNPAFGSVVLRVVDNMLERSILFEDVLTGDQIRAELGILFP